MRAAATGELVAADARLGGGPSLTRAAYPTWKR